MNRECVTSYYRQHITSDGTVYWPTDITNKLPTLTLCILGSTPHPLIIPQVKEVLGTVNTIIGDDLVKMIENVVTPWWLLLFENEFLTKGLLTALPLLTSPAAATQYDGFTFFRRTDKLDVITYHTRLINSCMPYDVTSLRPAKEGRFERILDGWVVYDKNKDKN